MAASSPGASSPPVGDAAGHEHRPRLDVGRTLEQHGTYRAPCLEAHHVAGQHHLGPEPCCLRHRAVGQVGPGEALGEAEIVLDRCALGGLPARGVALDDHGLQALGGGVDRGGQTGGTGAHDAQVVELPFGPGVQPQGVGQLDGGRSAQRDPVGQGHHRQVAHPGSRQLEQAAGLVALLHLQPPVRDVVAGEEGLDLVGALRPAVADDPDLGRTVGVTVRPVAEELVEHRVQPVLGRVPRLHQVVVERDVVDRPDGHVGVRVRREQHQLGVR